MKQTFVFLNFVGTATNFQILASCMAAWVYLVAFAMAFTGFAGESFDGRLKQVADAVTPANRFILKGGIS